MITKKKKKIKEILPEEYFYIYLLETFFLKVCRFTVPQIISGARNNNNDFI